jgi:hypothetical protein
MLHAVKDWINQIRPAAIGKRRAITSEEIGMNVGCKEAYVSKLFTGREVPAPENQQVWPLCRRILRFMLTGQPKGSKLDRKNESHVVAGRILTLFFEASTRDGHNKVPYYFDVSCCDVAMAQRSEERLYTALDMGATLLGASDGQMSLTLISGGTGFGHLNSDGGLSPRGWAMLALASVGAKIRYICHAASSALTEATKAKAAAMAAGEGGTWPDEVMCLLHRFKPNDQQRLLQEAHAKIIVTSLPREVLSPQIEQRSRSAKSTRTMSGATVSSGVQSPTILNPFLRFTLYNHLERGVESSELFIIRPQDATPLMLVGSQNEIQSVTQWLNAHAPECLLH